MHTRLLLHGALVGAFTTLGAARALAQRTRPGTPSEVIPVAYEITRPLTNACQASSRVEGSVAIFRPPRGRDMDLAYRPNLSIRTRVTCDDGTVRQFAPRLIQTGQFSSDQLANAISERGRVVTAMDQAHACTMMPVAHVDARDITFRGMNTSCVPTARGGGPPSVDPPWCVGADAERDPNCAGRRERNQ